ncbi:unnamed protein product [Durusdinium trenchii]|uniref:Uncharacterized protein n=1 Tax=Durusdinium trenchii TaxID=1381693 RepID=A0ABP0LZX1_9DINO
MQPCQHDRRGGDCRAVQDQLQNVREIFSTDGAFAALLQNGGVVAWGDPVFGGDSSLVQDQLEHVQEIHTCGFAFAAVLHDRRVVTWGASGYGGDSTEVQDQLENVQEIYATHWAFAAVLSTRRVVTWGVAESGGDSSLVQDELRDVKKIYANEKAFAAVLSNDTVVTWGDAKSGGDSSHVRDRLKNVKEIMGTAEGAFAALLGDETVVTWGAMEQGGDSRHVEHQLQGVQSIHATRCAFAALLREGRVITWGDARYGGDCWQVQEQLKQVQQIHGADDAFVAVLRDGAVVTFHDLYAMAVPLFLPDRNGLHHTAFTFLSRFQKSLTTGMPFKERLPEMEEKETHPFSPFDFEYLEVREFWLDYTEYVTAPAILHFASLPDLLVQVYQLDAIKTHGRIRAHNARRLRESRNFWSNALQRLATPWAPWGGEHWDASCGAEHPLKPQGSVLWSPLDGAPWIHAAPSRAEPLLIMDGADGALSAAVREAVEEFQRRAKPSHSEVFAGALDWKAIHQRLKGCAGGRRVEKLRCLLVMERVRPFLPLLRLTDLVRKGRRQLSRLLDPEGSVALAIWRMRKCVVLLPEPGFQEVIAYHFPYLKLNNQELLWPNRTTSSSSTGFGHRQIRAPHFLVSRLSSQLRRERLLHRAGRRQFVRQLQRLRAETR